MEFLVEQLKTAIQEKFECKMKCQSFENHTKSLSEKIERLESENKELVKRNEELVVKLNCLQKDPKICDLKVESGSWSFQQSSSFSSIIEGSVEEKVDVEDVVFNNSAISKEKDNESWPSQEELAQPAEEEQVENLFSSSIPVHRSSVPVRCPEADFISVGVEETAQAAHERGMREFIKENAEFEQRINSEPNAACSPDPRRKNSKRNLETEFIIDANTDPFASISKKSKAIHTCTVCQKKYARKDTLKRHILTIHKKLFNLYCDQLNMQ